MDAETRVRTENAGGDIDIRLRHLSQLFDSLDPSPFREGALTKEAEVYLTKKVQDLPDEKPVRIVIHLPADDAMRRLQPDIAAAFTGHFAFCERIESKQFKEALRAWRQSALIGFAVLSICLFLAWQIAHNLPARPLTRILQESFVILGWVSVWKPIETALYELLPPAKRRRRRLLRRLATADVILRT
ncbi:hypothetical protein E6C67_15950 [Azospirillum sp. TSA2s]|uniref:hypothetical protein n=1 Tax=Azospirillum sp. TSA2s TaxID=709810 RepID=UPI0010AB1F27|nr:hypothetical protein [Azospirillum sp. TSA2s]QCG95359.1 hypothetical protein E6C67_15950 [Azospirillum sp. TSA2s]